MKPTKKRIIIVFAILTMALVLSCAFAACDKVEPDKEDVCEHVEVTDNAVEPTCTEKGLTEGTHCSKCGKILQAQTEIPALGHDFSNEWTIDKKATCTQNGSKSHHCTRCTDKKDVTEITATGHVGGKATCEEQAVCEVCHEKYGEPLGHDYSTEWTIDVPATCTQNGSKSHHCTRCEVKSDVTEIPTIEHSESSWIIDKEATCTEDGSKHTECTVCHTTIKTEEIPALGHTGGTATCTEQSTCSICGEKYGDALGHKYGDLISKTEPTCSENGVEAHYKCSVCNKVFKDDEHKTETTLDELTIAINPNAHNFGEWIKNKDADTHTRVCSYNNEHTETENCHGGKATCIEQATCEKCSAKYGELAQHDYKDGVCTVCRIRRISEGLTYSLNSDGNGYTVTGIGTCTDKELIIPSEYDAKPVTSIGDKAFERCTGLTSVTIPNSVTSIGVSAFSGCDKLQDIYITDIVAWCNISGLDNLMRYGASNKTLYINNKLATSITIPNGVTAIPSYAFYNCTGLTSVTIPNSVTSIGSSAFSGCTGLTSITVAKENTKYHSAGNCLIETESKTLIAGCKNSIIPTDGSVTSIGSYAFYNCTELTSVTIGGSVTSVGSWAFRGCIGLTSVKIPDSVTSIGSGTFYNCTGLTSVTIGGSVTIIGDNAFEGCTRLTSITIPDSVKSIGSWAFRGCTGLTSVTIPDSVTSIGSNAFYNCTGLTSVTIGNGVKSIGEGAFYNCSELTNVTIPDSVTSIGSNAFFGCTRLASVKIPDSVTSIGSWAFYNTAWYDNQPDGPVYAGKVAYEYKGTMPINTSIVLKKGTLGIADYAFYNCTGLTSVTIPDSVTSIGEEAFYGCTGLTSINFKGTIEQWNAISKGYNWKDNVPATQVICTDGTVSI